MSLQNALRSVNADVAAALEESHQILTRMGQPHVLIGGLAVGAHGYTYSTRDVDWLVPDEFFEGSALIRNGTPTRVRDVAIDYLTVKPGPFQRELLEMFSAPAAGKIPVVPLHLLVYLKLVANRSKDRTAIVELTKAGAEMGEVTTRFMDELGIDHPLTRRLIGLITTATEEAP